MLFHDKDCCSMKRYQCAANCKHLTLDISFKYMIIYAYTYTHTEQYSKQPSIPSKRHLSSICMVDRVEWSRVG